MKFLIVLTAAVLVLCWATEWSPVVMMLTLVPLGLLYLDEFIV